MNVRGIDWGLNHPTVCLWASVFTDKKLVYIYDEHFRSGLSIRDHCEIIKDKTGSTTIDWTVIDPSMFKRDKFNVQRTEADEFSRYGVYCIPGNNQRIGYDVSKMYFKRNMIKIHPKCKNLIQQLKVLQWGEDVGDDATDAMKYMLLRIHETINGMNVFDAETKIIMPEDKRQISIYDERLFPKQESLDSWGFEGVY